MNQEPAEDAVDLVMAVIGVGRSEAIQKLKANGNDTERAINAHYENPSADEAQQMGPLWDENAFHSDKTKVDCQNQNVPSFNLRPPSETLGSNIFGAAPSRPPSRVSHRGDRDIIDLTSDSPKVNPNHALTHAEREEQELQQAMALSMGGLSQESGVAPAPGPYFGPASRDHYDSSKWALTHTGSTHEIILNPEPADRKRERDEPPFMKPSTVAFYLSSLITILHAIPLAREALLLREHLLNDYGYNSEWWDGAPVQVPRVVNVGDQQHDWEADEVLYETQRLMAFLDLTKRSYGSVEVLANLKSIQDQNMDAQLANYLKAWQDAASRNIPGRNFPSLFQSVGVRKSMGEDQQVLDTMPFFTLDIGVDEEIADKDLTLYAALDELIWSDTEEDLQTEETYLESIGDIFIMKVSRQSPQGSGLGIRIPAVWYPDRYLERCREAATGMRISKAEIGKLIRQTQQIETRLTELVCHRTPTRENKVLDARKLLETVIASFEQETLSTTDESVEGSDGALPPPTRASTGSMMVKELKAVYESVNSKLRSLEKQREEAHNMLKDLSTLLTQPNDNDPQQSPTEKYTLRGVSTDPQITYVLCPCDPEATDSTPDAENRGWQWWKLSYTPTDSKPVSKVKVRETQVLKAAREESRSALLVYASETAASGASIDELPTPLKKFVHADNHTFSLEVDIPPSPVSPPRTSPKRKASDSEEDLIDLHPSPFPGAQSHEPRSASKTQAEPELPLENHLREFDSPIPVSITRHIPDTVNPIDYAEPPRHLAPPFQASAPLSSPGDTEKHYPPRLASPPTSAPSQKRQTDRQDPDEPNVVANQIMQTHVP
ncbi:hypothetical protein L228DRAFT_260776 [Xylona heveae TC161]|uniref:UBA domain-containing protein n=1 Tax=Xylona heveae (strain CBS 132557 / TC161) TaxID=1328760 RepID=A0A165GUI5_XYLHT|nr:hypothetical protein L228DRAFT_260776 [Xylona heveae TC161]KZF22610.1 hypothetical protein L228DRAFT_260776 [Xylona heveae TC161]